MKSEKTKFSKVSFEQWCKANNREQFGDDESVSSIFKEAYDSIKLPKRSTTGSAGYDFFMPFDVTIPYHGGGFSSLDSLVDNTVVIPTGVRCEMDEWLALFLFPKSGLGFKYQLGLANTIGVADSDYYYADNEGHIFIKLVNNGTRTIKLQKGDKFAQGIFLPYYITVDDDAEGIRTGGFGSTGR